MVLCRSKYTFRFYSETPLETRTGVTSDFSTYIQFDFWVKLLVLHREQPWLSSKEKPVRYLGVANNIGNHLTFLVFAETTRYVGARSVLHRARCNKQVTWDPSLQHEHQQRDSIGGIPRLVIKLFHSRMMLIDLLFFHFDAQGSPLINQSKVIGIPISGEPLHSGEQGKLALASTPLEENPHVGHLKIRRTHNDPVMDVWREKMTQSRTLKSKRNKSDIQLLGKRIPKKALLTTDMRQFNSHPASQANLIDTVPSLGSFDLLQH